MKCKRMRKRKGRKRRMGVVLGVDEDDEVGEEYRIYSVDKRKAKIVNIQI